MVFLNNEANLAPIMFNECGFDRILCFCLTVETARADNISGGIFPTATEPGLRLKVNIEPDWIILDFNEVSPIVPVSQLEYQLPS